MSNKDNNIRYVALNTLVKVVAIEPNAVQRHRNTILDCLRDPDISIRRRALELSFTLINESNVKVLVRELLAFLEIADNEFKPNMTSQIGIAADRYAPNKRWHIDTMLRVLKLAGQYVKEQILSSFVRLIATSPELQTYSVKKLYAGLKDDITQEGLTLAATWVIGEFADALLRGTDTNSEDDVVQNVKESDVVDLFFNILNSSYSGQVVTQYIITASVKLTSRLQDPSQIERIRRLLQSNQTNLDVEIQQRAVEYSNLFSVDSIRRGVLEKMPPPEIREDQRVLGEAPKKGLATRSKKPKQITEQDMLLDLMAEDSAPIKTNNGSQNNADLLMDILGSSSSAPINESETPQKSNVDAIMGLFGNSSSPAPTQSSASNDLLGGIGGTSSPAPSSMRSNPSTSIHPAYSKNGLQIGFQLQRSNAGIQALARFRNTGSSSLSNVSLQAAVPKTQKLQLQPISTTDLQPAGEATQQLRIVSVQGVCH